MKKITSGRRKVSLVLMVVFILMFTLGANQLIAFAEAPTSVALDISSSNWELTQGYTGAVDKTGAVEFTGGTTYNDRVTYKKDIDVSTELSLDIKFTAQTLGNGSGFVAFTLGKDNDSFNNNSKGLTFLLYKKSDVVIECAQNLGPWWDFPLAEINSIKIKKGTTGWELYFKNSKLTTDTLIATVPFTTVSADLFASNKAKLSIVTSDSSNKSIKFEVSNFNNTTSASQAGTISSLPAAPTPKATNVDVTSTNWELTQGYTNVADKDGTVEFTGGTTYNDRVTFKKDVEISTELSFDIKFTAQTLGNGSGFVAFTLGKDNDSFNNNSKGLTFLLYKKSDGVIECAQNLGPWWEFPFAETNSVKIKKGTSGWELYFKNSVFKADTLIATVPFTTVGTNIFTNNKAKLSIVTSDSKDNTVKFNFSNFVDFVTPVVEKPIPKIVKPVAPTGVNILINGTKASLSWKAVAGATSYKVYYKKQNGSYIAITTKKTSLQISNLSKATKYFFKITAVNSVGEGVPSVEISKVTKK